MMSGRTLRTLLVPLLLLSMIIPADAFLRHLCFNPLGLARIDPLVSPGKPAEHVHHLHGAHNVGLNSTDANYLLESNCTSCSITVDKSNYWTPAMYFQHENGSFSLLTTASAITIYYKLEKRANFLDKNYTVFPKGFRMLAGTNSKRSWVGPWPVPPQSIWGPNDTTQAALAEKAIGFNCLNYHGAAAEPSLAFPYIRDKAFTDAHCSDGLRAELLFPSCWDGVNLDSHDHKSHVAYPRLIQDGSCPDTHPVFLPVLFFETIWNTQQFAGVPGQYVLANGDPTGYSYHADFIAAWDDGVLQRIMDDPTCTDHDLQHRVTNGIQEECLAVKDSIQSQTEAAKCQLVIPEALEHETVGGTLLSLPNDRKVVGNRHDPGDQFKDPSAYPSDSSSAVSTSLETHPDTVSAATTVKSQVQTTTAMTSVTESPEFTVLETSTSTDDSMLYEVIVAATVVTDTVTETIQPTLVHRHVHHHAHGHRRL